jgi:hypothetical protein
VPRTGRDCARAVFRNQEFGGGGACYSSEIGTLRVDLEAPQQPRRFPDPWFEAVKKPSK